MFNKKKYDKKYYQKHKKKRKQQRKEYYQKMKNDKKKYEEYLEKVRIWNKNDKLKNPQKYKDYQKKKSLMPKTRWDFYKKNARNRNIKWELTYEQFMTFWQKPCYYCGTEIETIGLDRVDNSKGYNLDNIVSCCSICNYAKRKLTKEQFIQHCKKVAKFF